MENVKRRKHKAERIYGEELTFNEVLGKDFKGRDSEGEPEGCEAYGGCGQWRKNKDLEVAAHAQNMCRRAWCVQRTTK